MRELARSMMRFSWAMSMLGVRQIVRILSPGDGWDRSADALDTVSDVAAKQMGETVRSYYEAGDRLQSGMMDTLSRMVEGSWDEPGKVMNETWEAVERTWSGVKEDLRASAGDEE